MAKEAKKCLQQTLDQWQQLATDYKIQANVDVDFPQVSSKLVQELKLLFSTLEKTLNCLGEKLRIIDNQKDGLDLAKTIQECRVFEPRKKCMVSLTFE